MDIFTSFISQYRLHNFSKGEVIIYQDEVPEAAYYVKSGIVKSYDLTAQGEEKPISYSMKNEIFPIGWVFSKLEQSSYYYEAITDCQVYLIPRQAYTEFLRANPEFMYQAFESLVGRYIIHQSRINALEQSKAADKVAYTLDFLVSSYGEHTTGNNMHLKVPMSQQDLANFMGLTRETTGIELKKLERRGILTYRRPYYSFDMTKLAKLVGNEQSYEKPEQKKLSITNTYNAYGKTYK